MCRSVQCWDRARLAQDKSLGGQDAATKMESLESLEMIAFDHTFFSCCTARPNLSGIAWPRFVRTWIARMPT